jgi:hypothetical protein
LKFLVAILFPLYTSLFFEHEISYDNILLTHLTIITITVPGASFRAPWRRLGVPNWRRETAAMDPWISCFAPLPSSELPRLSQFHFHFWWPEEAIQKLPLEDMERHGGHLPATICRFPES